MSFEPLNIGEKCQITDEWIEEERALVKKMKKANDIFKLTTNLIFA